MKRPKIIQVNGTRAIIQHSKWMGWTVQHVTDGHHCSGHCSSLADVRRGVHAVTSPEGRAKMALALAR